MNGQYMEALNFANSVDDKAQEKFLPLWQRCLLGGLAAGWGFCAVEEKTYAISLGFIIALFVVGVPVFIVARRRSGVRPAYRQNPATKNTVSWPYICSLGGIFLPFMTNIIRDQFDSTPLWVQIAVAAVFGLYCFWLCGVDRYVRP